MVMVAEADAVRLAVSYIAKAMPRDPVNARWWLERRHPVSFKARSEIETKVGNADDGAPFEIIIVPSDRPQAELDEMARPIAKLG